MKKLFTIFLSFFLTSTIFSQVTVTIDRSVKYQTIEGWGHGGGVFAGCGGFHTLTDTTYADSLSYDYLDYAIDILGLTGSRTTEIGPRVDGTGMDNGDCDSLDWSKFQSNSFLPWHYKYVKYFSDRIKAMGYQPSFYSSPTYPTLATAFKPWVINHPGERAQQIWANALFWKNNYGVDINYAVIYNEPSSPITSAILAEDIKALGPRFQSHGLNTKVQYAEGVTPQTNWNFITPVKNDSDLWAKVGRISYHNYGNYNSPDIYRPYMRDFADSLGITTAQTEMGDPSFDNLYSDLTLGGVSYWEVGYSSNSSIPLKSGQTQFTFVPKFFRLRQLLHYVRPGDVRISAVTNDTNLHVLAFNHEGKTIALIENLAAQKTITISGMTHGIYNVSYSKGDPSTELGLKNVGADGIITLDVLGNNGVTTLYPYSGTNHSPAILNRGSDKGYLLGAESAINLTVTANDVELDNLTYQWSVLKQPDGSNVLINTPNNPTSSVTGLTQAGLYIFRIEVSDGINVSSEKVYLYKYASNPPAMMGQAGFRIAPPYGLVFSGIGDTTHANIELPTSGVTLQVGIGDLAGSDFTGRGKWTLVSAPAGANVTIGETIWIYISIRAQVTGMTIPGDYVFRVVVTDNPYPDQTTIIKCTVHPTSSAPAISSIIPVPAILTLPVSETKLTAVTSDPEGDLLRHWWAIKSVPAGAKPLFDHQGLPVSNVSGLTIPGTYQFTLRAFDDLHMTTKDVTVVVNPEQGNSITITNYPTKICPRSFIDIEYLLTGIYSTDNYFYVQLSDTNGSFSNPVEISRIKSTIAEKIYALIPKSTSPGTGYHIRILSTNPPITSPPNDSDITINSYPQASITGDSIAYKGGSYTYIAGSQWRYYWWGAIFGTINGPNNDQVVNITWNEKDTGYVLLIVDNDEDCSDTTNMKVLLVVNSIDDNIFSDRILITVIPNPIINTTKIEIRTNKIDIANIQIINSLGNIVKDFGLVSIEENTKTIDWDRTDMNDKSIPSGIYFIKLSSKYGVAITKAVVLR